MSVIDFKHKKSPKASKPWGFFYDRTFTYLKGLFLSRVRHDRNIYLTRRKVDVALDRVILEEDCGSFEGLELRFLIEGGDVVEPLRERV